MQLDEMLAYNQNFVEKQAYKPYQTDSIPNERTVIFTCMDSRLVELLPKALNIHNGDIKMVKNGGAIIRKPFDSIMKSILVAIYELKAEQVIVIGHYDCGMSHMDTDAFKQKWLTKVYLNRRWIHWNTLVLTWKKNLKALTPLKVLSEIVFPSSGTIRCCHPM